MYFNRMFEWFFLPSSRHRVPQNRGSDKDRVFPTAADDYEIPASEYRKVTI